MKRLALYLFFASLLLAPSNVFALSLSNFETPESVIVDPEDGSYYVSNIAGGFTEKDGNGYISKISPDGNTVIQKFVGTKKEEMLLHSPKGLAISGQNLFATDIDTVKGYNKTTGKPSVLVDMSNFNVKFLNDITVDSHGALYVTDTMTNQIFRIDPSQDYEVTLIKESPLLGGPNGILVNPQTHNLIVVTLTSGQILEIDRTGGVHVLKRGLTALDGVDYDNKGNLYVSSYEKGEIYKISHMGRGPVTTFVSGLTSPADISYDRKKEEILIPSMKTNTVSTVSGNKK